MSAEVVGVEARMSLDGVDLLVVGAPTYAHAMSRPTTRKSAQGQAGVHPVNLEVGIREFLDGIRSGAASGRGRVAAAFDTRFAKPRWLTGSAASGAARKLRRAGFHLVTGPESFFVEATRGPLAEGEIARARAWGEFLAAQLASAKQHRHGKAA